MITSHCRSCGAPFGCPDCHDKHTETPETIDEHMAGLEVVVTDFAQRLYAAQETGVPRGVLMGRMLMVFKKTFGEPPPGVDINAMLQLGAPT